MKNKFLDWLIENNKFTKEDFIKGKTNKITLDVKTLLGHIPHTSGSGAHDSTPKRQRTRQGQKNYWLKDQGNS